MKKILLSTVAALTLVGAAHAEADKSVLSESTCVFVAGSDSGAKFDFCMSAMEGALEAGFAQGNAAVAANTSDILNAEIEAITATVTSKRITTKHIVKALKPLMAPVDAAVCSSWL